MKWFTWPILILALLALFRPSVVFAGDDFVLDCDALSCDEVLPGAVRFEPVEEGLPYQAGYDQADTLVGWVALSTDIVDIRAYSGKPLVTLLGLDTEGVITGARIIHHSEPILLVGIPESALTAFVNKYVGLHATQKVVVGSSNDTDAVQVDAISGATVTALAQNQTIQDTARELGAAVGVVSFGETGSGEFVSSDEVWSWSKLEDKDVFGRLTVTQAEMEVNEPNGDFIDLRFTLADAPQVGRALLGDLDYKYMMSRLEPGEHLLVVLGNGSSSFKGSGFVRGGVFDRVRLEQGLRSMMFRDSDYFNLSNIQTEGAPKFKEGAVFITHAGSLDPGAPFDLVFMGSRYDGRGGFSREFHEFRATHELPSSVYKSDNSSAGGYWRQAWANQKYKVAGLTIFLLFIVGLFAQRKWLTGDMRRLNRLHLGVLIVSFVVLGVYMRAQPSVTQIFTFLDGIVNEWRMGLFLSEPVIFVSWVFIAIVVLVWGRGVFCGWVCPYGAMSELLFRLGRVIRLPEFEVPDRIHRVLRHSRYVILAVLVGTFFYSSELGELLAEVEPFKTTFFVAPWSREAIFFGWWLFLLGLSTITFRPFCRYLCPLGAGLALPSSFRLSGPQRRSFCSSCQICTKGCEPKAIRANGKIDSRECLSCMECEVNYRDPKVCPPLVALERMQARTAEKGLDPAAEEKKRRLEKDLQDVPSGTIDLWRSKEKDKV